MRKIILILVAMLSFSFAFCQTNYYWRNSATTSNWNNSNNWWNGTTTALPSGNEVIIFDNDNIPITINDLTNTNRFIIKFNPGVTVQRIIKHTLLPATHTFYDYSGAWPEILNNTSPAHILNFPIKNGHSDMNIKASEGNLYFQSTIDTNGRYLHLYGHAGPWPVVSPSNLKTIVLKGNVFGNGKLFLKQNISVLILADATVAHTNIDEAELSIGDNGTTGFVFSDISMNDDAELIFNRSDNITYTNIISGTGNLTKQGSGALRLTGNNTYSGTTTVFDGALVINGSIDCGQLIVKNGATLIINSTTSKIHDLVVETGGTVFINTNATLTIQEGIVNNGTIDIKDQGSIVQVTNSSTNNTGSGTYNTAVKISTISSDPRYTYYASPAQGETLNVFNAWAEMGSLYSFDGATQDWSLKTSTTTMNAGEGFIVRTPTATGGYPYNGSTAAKGLTTFTGAFNNGIVTQALYHDIVGAPDPMDDSSALVGNPYPSAVKSDDLIVNNPRVASLHFWRHAAAADGSGNFNESYAVRTSGLSTYSAPVYIASGQGFFAVANGSTGTLEIEFKNEYRYTGNNTNFLRPNSQDLDNVWLNLTTSTNVDAQIAIGFNPICTDGFDNQYDAHNINSGSYLSFYSKGIGANTDNLVIQLRNLLNNNDVVIPLGFNLSNASITNLTISIDHFENLTYYDMYLKDLDLNIVHDLKLSDYDFTTSQTGNISTRFELLFSRNTLATSSAIINQSNLVITNNAEDSININMLNDTKITNFKAFGVLGKLLINKNTNATDFTIHTNVKAGTVLFVKATLENGQILSTKFVKM